MINITFSVYCSQSFSNILNFFRRHHFNLTNRFRVTHTHFSKVKCFFLLMGIRPLKSSQTKKGISLLKLLFFWLFVFRLFPKDNTIVLHPTRVNRAIPKCNVYNSSSLTMSNFLYGTFKIFVFVSFIKWDVLKPLPSSQWIIFRSPSQEYPEKHLYKCLKKLVCGDS